MSERLHADLGRLLADPARVAEVPST